MVKSHQKINLQLSILDVIVDNKLPLGCDQIITFYSKSMKPISGEH